MSWRLRSTAGCLPYKKRPCPFPETTGRGRVFLSFIGPNPPLGPPDTPGRAWSGHRTVRRPPRSRPPPGGQRPEVPGRRRPGPGSGRPVRFCPSAVASFAFICYNAHEKESDFCTNLNEKLEKAFSGAGSPARTVGKIRNRAEVSASHAERTKPGGHADPP